ncbi:MAG: FxsA family protein [bacterium]|nr:FxsA family protein [bacterium]
MRPLPALFALFLLTPIIEIVLFITIGDRIGLVPTLAIVVVTAFVGASLVSRQGRAELAALQSSVVQGVVPTKELAHGAMILVSGALLLTPGFLTDVVGFSLLVPQFREVVRRWFSRRYGKGPVIVQ